ncbi:MAG: hypothetical protein OXT67_09645 [Zetaproteobacteria bacterium]|nr:hypothetical protein [Zetaproteobacteria bacterium]
MANIGDLVLKSGMYTNPGVVVEKKVDGSVVVDTEPLTIHKYHRYSNTTGLTVEEKNTFNKILDRIYAKEDNLERLNDIQKDIDRLKTDTGSQKIVQYLRNQQAVLIRKAKVLPRTYNWDEAQLKT